MLEIKNLSKSFDGVQAVSGFSLSLQRGKITSLIGPNGAGKTTVFNVVTNFLPRDKGIVFYKDVSLSGRSPWQVAQLGISRTFQNLRLFKKLNVLQNVLLGMQGQKGENFLNALFVFSNNSRDHRGHIAKANELLEFVGLTEEQNQLAENLSYGQQKLLSIACCLSAEPEILLLDEPVSGVQPAMIERIRSILRELVEKWGKTVFLIEHDIDFVLRVSHTVVVMDEGKKIAEGDPSVIQRSPEILEAYLS